MTEDTEKILRALAEFKTEVRADIEAFKSEVRADIEAFKSEVRGDIKSLSDRLDTEVKRWDERFFQLSKDTLVFTRTVITTAAIVAVLTPIILKLVDSPLFTKAIGKLLGE
ncbi:MAG: hypothetical protein RMK91_01650 [Pseudanabaenaceae cyanobacterium SKYGB_i_bin29]|nr:hypothetical protein [Pseudanabaenaceae cyanobacterium SKYG29]MDW8420553.1 hypothetical protein [Pseudanabaenaceae cyanobacterium SKYGB_i_bin29]